MAFYLTNVFYRTKRYPQVIIGTFASPFSYLRYEKKVSGYLFGFLLHLQTPTLQVVSLGDMQHYGKAVPVTIALPIFKKSCNDLKGDCHQKELKFLPRTTRTNTNL